MIYFKTNINRPLSYFKAGQYICEQNWYHKPIISKNDYEIIIGIKGTQYIQQDDEKYEVNPGDVLFLLPGILHFGYAPSDEGTSTYWLHFFCNADEKILTESEAYQEIISVSDTNNLQESILLPTFFSLIDTGKSFMYLKQILHIANSPYYTHFSTDYLVTDLAIELTQQFINSVSSSVTTESAGDKKFSQILEWVRINATKGISVKIVADKFNFTPDYLTRLFKRNIGMSTLKYINTNKISKSKELLINTNNNINEISYLIGFKDEKYYMKLFKRIEGVTPSQYRDAYPKTYINTGSSDPDIPLPNHLASTLKKEY